MQMTPSRLRLAAVAGCALATASLGVTSEAPAKSNAGAVAAGIIVGAAVGAAVSSNIKHNNRVYVPGPPPPPSNKGFSPKPGVWCYPAQRACYNADGAYAPNWTYKVYAR
jgi:hypothetical protein